MSRVFNFSAGPSCLPEEVLNECAAEMLDFNGTGQSVMEMSHRSKAFEPIILTESGITTVAALAATSLSVLFSMTALFSER